MMRSAKQAQSGAALIISLIILVILVIIGLAAMRTSLLEEKMAGNSRDMALAFQAAETALRDAEAWLDAQTNDPLPTEDGNNRIWNSEQGDLDANWNNNLPWWQEPTRGTVWWQDNGVQYGADITNVTTRPMTIIEYLVEIPDDQVIQDGNRDTGRSFYRITARATGGSNQSRVLLQSTVAKRY
ncbi:Type IV fimbrial biogenesis protein PilX [Methylophaga frappieri]|uniref:Type IV fimbrial biogenesis protein PilX n=1 Tax=Methylophaga frappieri (strain ATCC BAA-2434 / DSM 25690 / JAM7) TaxID=754477 RepID=I1YKL3_METFJ|nr:PilX N-terminal domain-containing pilus assembly protein [Methylophaga frappieri]AFJ03456.1 Type IV fimbrial biogenesis protein PilX [Methylophaga frappieri]